MGQSHAEDFAFWSLFWNLVRYCLKLHGNLEERVIILQTRLSGSSITVFFLVESLVQKNKITHSMKGSLAGD